MTPPLRADGSPLSDVVTYVPIDACPLFAPPFDWNGGAFFALSVAARHFITVPENGTPYVVWKMKSYIRCGVYTSDETRGGLESAGVYTPRVRGGRSEGIRRIYAMR